MRHLDDTEAAATMRLAIGRLFRLAAHPTHPDDAAQYAALRSAAMDAAEALSIDGRTHQHRMPRDGRT